MCGRGQHDGAPSGAGPAGPVTPAPGSAGEAMGMILAGLGWLAGADMASVPAAVQADCLRGLEQARSVQVAAHARVLGAFDAALGYEDDGCRSARTWLMWQTQVTSGAATASVQWMRRLRAHPDIAKALRGRRVSASWARQICDWSDKLPEDARDDADAILLAAAAGGAGLADLADLAEQMRQRLASPDGDGDDGFEDRYLRLQTTLGGAGTLDGDLTPRCAAALQAVLDALGKKAGPEDTRTLRQRHHDALEEAARRLIASGCVPGRAGQPAQIQLNITLDDLLRRMNASSHGDSDPDRPVPPGPAAMPGDECDATIIPVVTGRVDHDLLDKLTAQLTSRTPWSQRPAYDASTGTPGRDTVRDLILANAIALLSGPGQIASVLRTGTLPPPAASISLPLDVGAATDTIPPHLRRAVTLRDKHCAAPGCTVPPAGCQIHHLIPRSQGGPTSLANLQMYCSFHHLICIQAILRSRFSTSQSSAATRTYAYSGRLAACSGHLGNPSQPNGMRGLGGATVEAAGPRSWLATSLPGQMRLTCGLASTIMARHIGRWSWPGAAIIALSVALAVLTVLVGVHKPANALAALLLQAGTFILAVLGAYVFAKASAAEAAQELIKPHARSAFRRQRGLYMGLGRLADEIERQRADDRIDHELGLRILLAMITEQVGMAGDALEDWRDLVPDEVAELEKRYIEARRGLT